MSAPPSPHRALARYRHLVEDNDQAPPQFWACFADSDPARLLPLPRVGPSPRDALDGLAAAVRAGVLPPLRWVLFCAETYMATAGDPGAFDNLERGELTARAEIGMGGVEEAIIAHFAHADGRAWGAIQKFARRPALGAVAWQEVIIYDSDEGGPRGAIAEDLAIIVGAPIRPNKKEDA